MTQLSNNVFSLISINNVNNIQRERRVNETILRTQNQTKNTIIFIERKNIQENVEKNTNQITTNDKNFFDDIYNIINLNNNNISKNIK